MSGLMITPFGVGIIGIYSAIVGVVLLWPLFRLLRNSRWKLWIVSIVGLPLLVAPWAEEAWIAWHFNEACKDAGVKVARQVEVDGLYDSTMRSGYELVRDKGYRFMEHPSDQSGKVDHVERIDGEWRKTVLDQPAARYHYRFSDPRQEIPISRRLVKFESQIVDSKSNEIIGLDTRFKRYPNTAEGLWLQFFGPSVAICEGAAPTPPNLRHLLYSYVLLPRK